MQINKHGTFYIRNGWPTKIIDTVSAHPYVFSPSSELDAVDEMGVGRVMVRAILLRTETRTAAYQASALFYHWHVVPVAAKCSAHVN